MACLLISEFTRCRGGCEQNFVVDDRQGDMICMTCGIVAESHLMDASEFRNRSMDDSVESDFRNATRPSRKRPRNGACDILAVERGVASEEDVEEQTVSAIASLKSTYRMGTLPVSEKKVREMFRLIGNPRDAELGTFNINKGDACEMLKTLIVDVTKQRGQLKSMVNPPKSVMRGVRALLKFMPVLSVYMTHYQAFADAQKTRKLLQCMNLEACPDTLAQFYDAFAMVKTQYADRFEISSSGGRTPKFAEAVSQKTNFRTEIVSCMQTVHDHLAGVVTLIVSACIGAPGFPTRSRPNAVLVQAKCKVDEVLKEATRAVDLHDEINMLRKCVPAKIALELYAFQLVRYSSRGLGKDETELLRREKQLGIDPEPGRVVSDVEAAWTSVVVAKLREDVHRARLAEGQRFPEFLDALLAWSKLS